MTVLKHEKPYGIYLWDTFDNSTILIDEADSIEEAEDIAHNSYGDSMNLHGADRIEVVDLKGNIILWWNIG